MRRLGVLPLAVFIFAACQDVPTSIPVSPQFEIKDATHNGGNPHFFLLPPMVDNASASFTDVPFDGSLDVAVEICVWSTVGNACGAALELYNMESGPGSETVRISGESYSVNWHTDGILNNEALVLEEGDVYRIRVLVGDRELGHADVDIRSSGGALKNLDTEEFIPLVDGRTLPIRFRIEEGALDHAVLVTAGRFHTCSLNADGNAYCWGYGYFGQRGDGTTTYEQTTPVAVDFAGEFVSLAAGLYHTCGLATDGKAYCWGYGGQGQLGNGTLTYTQTTPVAVDFAGEFVSVTAEEHNTCGLTADGAAYCWGSGTHGQLGDGSIVLRQATPVLVDFAGEFVSLAAGHRHTCGLTTDGAAYCWGYGGRGGLGNGTTTFKQPTPVMVDFADRFSSVTAGYLYTCGVTTDGAAYCWGYGQNGQLGDGTITWAQTAPVMVDFASEFVSLTAGYNHTCGLTTDGAAYCWGWGTNGQLGNGTLTYRQTRPVAVDFAGEFVSLDVAWYHTCGVSANGATYCWGFGEYGQLGDGTTTHQQSTPVAVMPLPPPLP